MDSLFTGFGWADSLGMAGMTDQKQETVDQYEEEARKQIGEEYAAPNFLSEMMRATLETERARSLRAEASLKQAESERENAVDALHRKGYRKTCDIPACNCGDQWSHGGHADQRLMEIRYLLESELEVEEWNGISIKDAIKNVIESRARLTERVKELGGRVERAEEVIRLLMLNLPDSVTFEYCWNECTSDEQDEVTNARQKASEWLKEATP